MAKPFKTKIRLSDGTAKFMTVNWQTLAEAEEKLGGVSLIAMFGGGEDNVTERIGFRAVLALLWAGMKSAGSDLTYDQVGNLLDGERMGEYFEAVGNAINHFATGGKSVPEGDGDPLEKPKASKSKPSTGGSSKP